MANKDLTSLKVYGNDDPAGSTYKVGGGGAGGGNLILTSATETDEGEEIRYLTHTDGSIVTWQEIYDALASGVYVVHVEETAMGDKIGTSHMVQQTQIVIAQNISEYAVGEMLISPTGTLQIYRYAAVSATEKLFLQDNGQ